MARWGMEPGANRVGRRWSLHGAAPVQQARPLGATLASLRCVGCRSFCVAEGLGVMLNGALRIERERLQGDSHLHTPPPPNPQIPCTVTALELRVGRLDAAPQLVFRFEGRLLLIALSRGGRRLVLPPSHHPVSYTHLTLPTNREV